MWRTSLKPGRHYSDFVFTQQKCPTLHLPGEPSLWKQNHVQEFHQYGFFVWYFNEKQHLSIESLLQLKRFHVRITVMSWWSIHASQQTGFEVTWKDTLKFRATMIWACKENSKLSTTSQGEGLGRQVGLFMCVTQNVKKVKIPHISFWKQLSKINYRKIGKMTIIHKNTEKIKLFNRTDPNVN